MIIIFTKVLKFLPTLLFHVHLSLNGFNMVLTITVHVINDTIGTGVKNLFVGIESINLLSFRISKYNDYNIK